MKEEKVDLPQNADDITDESAKKPKKRTIIVKFFNGEFLSRNITPRAVGRVVILLIITIFYINNRYDAQQQLLRISRLKVELQDIKYNALTQKAQVLHLSRQSKIEEDLKRRGSQLEIPSTPPFVIKR